MDKPDELLVKKIRCYATLNFRPYSTFLSIALRLWFFKYLILNFSVEPRISLSGSRGWTEVIRRIRAWLYSRLQYMIWTFTLS